MQQFDIRQVALAAIKLAHEASGAVVDEKEIPDASVRTERSPNNKPDRPGKKGDRSKPEKGRSQGNGETARIYVGAGRKDGIRPGDLVGAIANETSLSGREIGPIKLAEHFAIVGIPEWASDEVIAALKGTTLKGKKATIRRYTD